MLRRKVLSLATALVSLATSGLAVAQDATTPPPAPPPAAEPTPAAPPAAAGKEEKTEEITITGSRVRRKDLNTPAPVTVINREQVTSSGKVSLGDFLQALPEQGNAINTAVNNGGGGTTSVNLRSLGAPRTLVLVNGRRMVPGGSGADDTVDLGTIPASAVERIEVLKDGASAVYGSDAVAGVVNIITRKGWSGVEVSAFGGIAGQGDGRTTDVNFTAGTSGERGSLIFSAGMFDQRKVMAGERDFSKLQYFYDANGDNNSLGLLGAYGSGSSRVPGGRIAAGGTGNPAFNALQSGWGLDSTTRANFVRDNSMSLDRPEIQGCIGALAPGQPASECLWRPMNTTNVAPEGDLYNFAPVNYLLTPNQRISLYSHGDSRLGDSARAYFEAMYVNRESKRQLAPEPLIIGAGGVTDPGGNLVRIAADNLYNPFGKEFTASSRRLDEFGPRIQTDDIDSFRVVTGIDGTLPETLGPLAGWFWDASFNYGRTYGTFVLQGNLQNSRVQAALGRSEIRDGVPSCIDAADNVISGCVPLDLFHGAPSITQDQVNYLTFTGTSNGLNQMSALQVNTSGELFPLFSDRPVGLALGYEYRKLAGQFINDPMTAKFDNSNGGSFDTSGSYHVNEAYGEIVVPIVSGRQFVEDLEGTFAARVFDYSNFGSDWTYKVGARYRPVRDVTLRGTYSTAFRAPTISDLFAGQFDNFPNVSDPCASPTDPDIIARCGVAAGNGDDSDQLRSTNGGNPTLEAETAKIFTAGVVWEPSFLRNFSATLDYYNVKVDNAITTIGEATILNGCYVTGNNPSYCELVQRDATVGNQITRIVNINQNVGDEMSAGLDLALRYALPTVGYGRFGFTFDGTWLQKHDQTLADGSLVTGKGTYDLVQSGNPGQGGSNPAFKFQAGVLWGLKDFGAGVSTRFLSGFKECGNVFGDFSGDGQCYVDDTFQRHVSAYNTWDAFVSFSPKTVAGKTSLAVGVNNLFDEVPTKIYNTFASATDQFTYDQVGRFFYVRLTQSYY